MKKIVIIPSSIYIPIELQADFGPIPSVLVPLGSRTALDYIMEQFVPRGYDIIVAASQGIDKIREHIANVQHGGVRIVDVGATSDIGETIANSLQAIEALHEIEHMVINFGDTLIAEDIPDNGDFVVYGRQEDSFRWTTFELDMDNQIIHLMEKNTLKELNKEFNVFTGVFGVSDPADFQHKLRQLTVLHERSADSFYLTLSSYFNSLETSQREFIETENWWDFGHIDSYYATKKNYLLNIRHFNSVEIDARKGVIRKRSNNVDKFIKEIKWYLKLPSRVQYIAPRVLSYSLNYDSPFVDMEFYSYPALNDAYLYGNWDISLWIKVFDSLDSLFSDLGEYTYTPPEEEIRKCLWGMYYEKTIQRLTSILDDSEFEPFKGSVIVNGKTIDGLDFVMENLAGLIESSGVLQCENFTLSHGDLCFSNVLFDTKMGISRLIDPRGEFGTLDIYGDARYDKAKLCHSVEGDYDFIVNGLCDAEWAGNSLAYQPRINKKQKNIKSLFRSYFEARWGADQFAQVKFIEALLFLSMVPLHKDNSKAQKVFLAKGLEGIHDYVSHRN